MGIPSHAHHGACAWMVNSCSTGRIPLFRKADRAELFCQTLFAHRDAGVFRLHAFVVMPDHFHLVLRLHRSLAQAMQMIKGGAAHQLRQAGWEMTPVWQRGYTARRLLWRHEFMPARQYIENNPVRARLCESPENYPYSSANSRWRMDEWDG